MTSLPWFERIAKGIKVLLPDRALKFFPPEFTLRRPVLSLLEKRMTPDKECYLALFRIEFPKLQHEVPADVWAILRESARRLLRTGVEEHLPEDEFIVVDQFDRTDFAVLFSLPSFPGFSEPGLPSVTAVQLEEIRISLETGLRAAVPQWGRNLCITAATVEIPNNPAGRPVAETLRDAYQLAVAYAASHASPQIESLRRHLEVILDQRSVKVLAQPIMNLMTGDVYGWEILTRGPEGSAFHMPEELFRFASQSRLLSRLEFMVVGMALEEAAVRTIREPVFLNVTAVTLSHPLFLPHVLNCLERHPDLSPGQIFFEITERHEVTDLQAMADILASFRERGFRFAVDDAGAGYSSLQWIGELVPELIKIDSSMIRHVDRVAVKESMLRAFVTIAKEINCEIVAEGVEREEEADVLFRLDVGMGQGYYFARPSALLDEHERGMFQETKERIQSRRGRVAS